MKSNQKREQIASAFMEMLNDTPLEALRIQDLCEKAGVSKSTFYRLFTDKYELAFWIYKKLADEIVLSRPTLKCGGEWTDYIFAKMLEHKAFYRNIASYRGQNSFFDYLRQYYHQNLLRFRKSPDKELTEDQKYATYMLSIINAQITIDWILNGFQPEAKQVTHQAEICIPQCIREFWD